MSNDAETTVQALRHAVHSFNSDRDWHQFHTPRNLAVSIAIEAAELLEHFQWTDQPGPEQLDAMAAELADVVLYCLIMANALEIDLSQAIWQKLARNAAKYPVEEYRGRF
jgi:dCTP diphosphatase